MNSSCSRCATVCMLVTTAAGGSDNPEPIRPAGEPEGNERPDIDNPWSRLPILSGFHQPPPSSTQNKSSKFVPPTSPSPSRSMYRSFVCIKICSSPARSRKKLYLKQVYIHLVHSCPCFYLLPWFRLLTSGLRFVYIFLSIYPIQDRKQFTL